MRSKLWIVGTTVLLASTLAWSIAQGRDEEACKSECEWARKLCVEECARHSNPSECDAQCRDDARDCVHACRR